jgi:hypothetical protein
VTSARHFSRKTPTSSLSVEALDVAEAGHLRLGGGRRLVQLVERRRNSGENTLDGEAGAGKVSGGDRENHDAEAYTPVPVRRVVPVPIRAP